MSISATDGSVRHAGKTALIYLLAALLCALFGAVYELCSHGVYSYFMIYAFAVPLAGGALPYLILSLFPVKRYPAQWARNFHHAGIAALTVGSIVQGVLEIYGTTNGLVKFYWYAGFALILLSIVLHRTSAAANKKDTSQDNII